MICRMKEYFDTSIKKSKGNEVLFPHLMVVAQIEVNLYNIVITVK